MPVSVLLTGVTARSSLTSLCDQKDAAQREAGKVVAEYAAKGAVWLAKEGTKQLLGHEVRRWEARLN